MENVSSSLRASLILMLEPLFAASIAAATLGETLAPVSKLGAVTILVAIAIQAWGSGSSDEISEGP
jgi:drug/metabolite transporter (DMT)-like permease